MTKRDDKSMLGIFIGVFAVYLMWASFIDFQNTGTVTTTMIVLFVASLFFFFVTYKLVSD